MIKNCKFKKMILNLKFWIINMINRFWMNNHYEFMNFYSRIQKKVSPSNDWFENGQSAEKKNAAAAATIVNDTDKRVKKMK